MKTRTWLIILGICAVVLGGLGYHSTFNTHKDWAIFTSSKFGYTIKYPGNVTLVDDSKHYSGFENQDLISFVDGDSTLAVSAPYYNPNHNFGAKKKPVTVGGLPATQFDWDGVIVTVVEVSGNTADKSIDITFYKRGQSNILDQVMQTLSINK